MHFDNIYFTLMVYLVLGIGAGFLSGLLGAGGGLVMVPGLIFVFQEETMSKAVMMHVAVGTSLAAMIPVAIRSLISHMKHKLPFFPIFKLMAPGLIVGVITGGILAHFIQSHVLEIIFGIFVLLMAFVLLQERKQQGEAPLPGVMEMSLAGGFVGVQSGMLGVAGSAFSVPFLTYRGVSMHTAVIVSVAIAVTVSILGAVTFMLTGLHVAGLPHWCTGYIYWPAFIGLAIGGIFVAPIGAKISHRISARKLKVSFAIFLVFVSAKMLW